MKNGVLWNMKTQFVLHRGHNTSPLQNPPDYCYVRFEIFTAVIIRMPSSGMLHHVALIRTDVSEERRASVVRVRRIMK
jgi:hypothetical protein